MYAENDLLPISALQHLLFCPRQCALIHIEGLWRENYFTAQGRTLHEKAHSVRTETRPGLCIVRGLRLSSRSLGLSGQADVVEFHQSKSGCKLPGRRGRWQPLPVEYKRGRAKPDNCDRVQLCAQAICLEEMLRVQVPVGQIYYGMPKRREQVQLTSEIRNQTRSAAEQLHQLCNGRQTPKAEYGKKCKNCSLYTICMPKITSHKKSIEHYLSRAKEDLA